MADKSTTYADSGLPAVIQTAGATNGIIPTKTHALTRGLHDRGLPNDFLLSQTPKAPRGLYDGGAK